MLFECTAVLLHMFPNYEKTHYGKLLTGISEYFTSDSTSLIESGLRLAPETPSISKNYYVILNPCTYSSGTAIAEKRGVLECPKCIRMYQNAERPYE